MTKTNKQKLPALDNSGKVKNPDLSIIGENNYTSTVLKYGSLAIKYSQLKTKDKTIVGAINEINESGGGGGKDMEAGSGIYLTNNKTTINADVGRRVNRDTHEVTVVPNDWKYIHQELGKEWLKTNNKISGNYVYKSNAGTYDAVVGSSTAYIHVTGYETVTIYVKQDLIDKGYSYVILGNPNQRITTNPPNYRISYKDIDITDYVSCTYTGLDPTIDNFIQITYYRESRLKIAENSGPWYEFYPVPEAAQDVRYSTLESMVSTVGEKEWCKLALSQLSGLILKVRVRSTSNTRKSDLYLGNIDSEVSQSDYFATFPSSSSDDWQDLEYPEFAEGNHTLELLHECTEAGSGSYVTALVKYTFPDKYLHGRAYFYVVPSDPAPSKYSGEIFNDYANNVAGGEYSHAEGSWTNSDGDYSHAECYGGSSYGKYSHAEGYYSVAYGEASHAEGHDTYTDEDYAHSEGYYTYARGIGSHSEGHDTWAEGDFSHVEGFGTDTNRESIYTTAEGIGSHAEGLSSQVRPINSNVYVVGGHAEGIPAFKWEFYNDSKTYNTGDIVFHYIVDKEKYTYDVFTQFVSYKALQDNITGVPPGSDDSIWEEYRPYDSFYSVKCNNSYVSSTVNSGHGGHAEGIATYNTGDGGHTEGGIFISNGTAIGTYNTGYGGHAEGMGSQNYGNAGHAEGCGNTTTGSCGHSEGFLNWAIGAVSHVEGYSNLAYGDYQHVCGKFNSYADYANYVFIIGNGSSNSSRRNAMTVDWSGNTKISGDLTTGVTLSTEAQSVGAAINEIIQRLNNAGI